LKTTVSARKLLQSCGISKNIARRIYERKEKLDCAGMAGETTSGANWNSCHQHCRRRSTDELVIEIEFSDRLSFSKAGWLLAGGGAEHMVV
jgi:hypothetical protein